MPLQRPRSLDCFALPTLDRRDEGEPETEEDDLATDPDSIWSMIEHQADQWAARKEGV